MRRREFISFALGLAVLPGSSRSQDAARYPRIGVLWHAGSEEGEAGYFGPLREGFTNLGYIAGKNIVFEDRYSNQQPELFESLARELVNLKVDVLVVDNIPGVLALKRATSTIPIVFIGNPDPVGFKLVSSLGRPGGNITGISAQAIDLVAKRVQLFKEAIPRLSKVALLLNPQTQYDVDRAVAENTTAAEKLDVSVVPFFAREPDEIDRAFSDIVGRGIEAVIVAQHAMYFAEKKRIARLGLTKRIATMVPADVFVDEGALMYYGANWPAMLRDAAGYVKRILQGQNVADMPVQQPTKFELVVNVKTAKSLNIDIPQLLLTRADRIVE